MAIDQIEYCGGCPNYSKCDKHECVFNGEKSDKIRLVPSHEDSIQFGCVYADV